MLWYFSSEFGWTIDETLKRTIDELELLLEAGLEAVRSESGRQSPQKPTYQASDPNQLAAFASQVGIQIHQGE